MQHDDLETYFEHIDDLTRRLLPVCHDYSPNEFERLVHLITLRNLRFELSRERYATLVSRLVGGGRSTTLPPPAPVPCSLKTSA